MDPAGRRGRRRRHGAGCRRRPTPAVSPRRGSARGASRRRGRQPSRLRTFVEPERITVTARDGLAIPATLWRPGAATGRRDGITGPDGRPRPRRADRPDRPRLAARPPAPGPGGLRVPVGGLPGIDRLRPGVPLGEPRRVGPRGCPRRHRRRPLGRRPALVERPAGDVRWLVRRVPDALRAGRGAGHVGGRRRSLRRLRDRRELPPRRPRRSHRPPADDGLARRPGAGAAVPARLAALPRGADRGPAADPSRPQGPPGGAAHDREDGGGARDRGEAPRGALVCRRGPWLAAPREPARRLRADRSRGSGATSSTSSQNPQADPATRPRRPSGRRPDRQTGPFDPSGDPGRAYHRRQEAGRPRSGAVPDAVLPRSR